MITFVEGVLVEKQPGRAVMNVHGVGYELAIPLSTFDRLPDENQPCRLLTHFHVREDAQELFGFLSEGERQLFRMLLAVSGIGPKTAMSALSGLPARDFRAAIVGGDIKRLSSISGIGKKTAERMVVELRDKLSAGEALESVTGGAPATPGDLRIRVLHGRHHPRHPGLHQGLGARRGAAVVAARLQGHISRGTARLGASLAQGMHLGMRLAGAGMPAFTDNLPGRDNHAANPRVGMGRIHTLARQFEGAGHAALIEHALFGGSHCGLGSRDRRSISSRNSLRS